MTNAASTRFEIDWAALRSMDIERHLRERWHIETKHHRCPCPIHQGQNPTSFSIRGQRWFCPQCRPRGGDIVSLEALMIGLNPDDKRDTVKSAKSILGIADDTTGEELERIRQRAEHQAMLDEFLRVPEFKERYEPELRQPSKDEFRALSRLRTIDVHALIILARRGLLSATDDFHGQKAFVCTDRNREIYAARRIDGKPWTDDAKDKTRFSGGGNAHWPIGISHTKGFPYIAIAEGFPDFLSVLAHTMA
jgi:hypothetical protein